MTRGQLALCCFGVFLLIGAAVLIATFAGPLGR